MLLFEKHMKFDSALFSLEYINKLFVKSSFPFITIGLTKISEAKKHKRTMMRFTNKSSIIFDCGVNLILDFS